MAKDYYTFTNIQGKDNSEEKMDIKQKQECHRIRKTKGPRHENKCSLITEKEMQNMTTVK